MTYARARAWRTLAVAGLALACSSEKASDAAGHDPTSCPTNLSGAPLVFVPAGKDAFCIDAYEATRREYKVFFDAAVPASEQSQECTWNEEFFLPTDPSDRAELCARPVFSLTDYYDYPVGCVDWCDAKAYCEWAGKRLCGGLGGTSLDSDADLDPLQGEWMFACTAGGTFPFPYGPEHNPQVCVDGDGDLPPPGFSQATDTCVGASPPYDQIHDQVGNLLEWTAAVVRDTNRGIRGGSESDEQASCGWPGTASMQLTAPGIGIRCCADAI